VLGYSGQFGNSEVIYYANCPMSLRIFQGPREVRRRDVLAENRLPKVDVSVPASTSFASILAISGTKLALLGLKSSTVSQTWTLAGGKCTREE
jgi:hypothetical protein